MERSTTEQPEEIDKAGRWIKFVRRHFALPSWETVAAGAAGAVAAIGLFPSGRIAYHIQTALFQDSRWTHWWRLVIWLVAVFVLLVALFLKRRSDNRIAEITAQLDRLGGTFVIRRVEVVRASAKRCTVRCWFWLYNSYATRPRTPPETLFLCTLNDREQIMLVFNKSDMVYEGGCAADVFDDAIKTSMGITEVGCGRRFFFGEVSSRGFTAGKLLASERAADPKPQDVIVYYDTSIFTD